MESAQEQLFSEGELDSILRSWYQWIGNRDNSSNDVIEYFTNAGFPECAEYVEWFRIRRSDNSATISKRNMNRASKILAMGCISGNVRNNPADLICPCCGSRYIAKIECYDYLRRPTEAEEKQIKEKHLTPYDEILKPLTDSDGNPYINDEKKYKCLACFHKWGKYRQ